MNTIKRALSVLGCISLGFLLNGCTRAPMGADPCFAGTGYGGESYTPYTGYTGYQNLPPYYYGSATNPAVGYQVGVTPVNASFDPRFGMTQGFGDQNYVMARPDAGYAQPPTYYDPSYGQAPTYQTVTAPPQVMVPGIQGYGNHSTGYGIDAYAKEVASWNYFPYHPATNGGRLGGAQVVSTILQRAGALDRMHLDVAGLRRDLKRRGWGCVPPPSIQPGDVVVWRTSGSRRNVGVAVEHGGRICVVQNNSDVRRPILIPIEEYPYPAEEVLRRPGYA